MTAREGWGLPADQQRLSMSRHLVGEGLELGPGHHPFVLVLPGTTVRYVDRWDPEENARLFPELTDATFPEPDVIANLDTDRLGGFPAQSQDFVIASHVLEHLAEPIGMLDECHRVVRPGGSILILLPDRRRTSDERRPGTTLAHLVEEHAQGVTEVDDAHLEAFLTLAWQLDLSDPQERERLLRVNRARSVHVHCWTEEEFFEVLVHLVREQGHRWELVELLRTEDAPRSIEFGYVLRRSTSGLESATLADRLVETRTLLLEQKQPAPAPGPAVRSTKPSRPPDRRRP